MLDDDSLVFYDGTVNEVVFELALPSHEEVAQVHVEHIRELEE